MSYKLYSKIAEQWLEEGCYTHVFSFFADDCKLKELLFDLSFGLLVIDAIRTIEPLKKPTKTTCSSKSTLIINEATEKDLLSIKKLDTQLVQHLRSSPVFLHVKDENEEKETIAEIDEEFKSQYINSNVKTFLAQEKEEGRESNTVAGIRALLHKGSGCTIVQDQGTLGINFAYTYPTSRGKGAGKKLLNHLLTWGKENGMERCSVDFKSQNKEAKDFWLKYFDPICYTLIRRVDERIKR